MPKKTRTEVIADLMATVQQKDHTDSKEFREVLFSLNTVNSLGKKRVMVTTRAMQQLTPDQISRVTIADRDEVGFKEFAQAQQDLIKACDAYLGQKKFRFSISGRKRAKAVQALRDLAASENYRDADIEKLEKQGKTWESLHATARVVRKDASELDKAATAGAGTSERAVLKDGYFTAEQKSLLSDDKPYLVGLLDLSSGPDIPKTGEIVGDPTSQYRSAVMAYLDDYRSAEGSAPFYHSDTQKAIIDALKKAKLPDSKENIAFIFGKSQEVAKMLTAAYTQQRAKIPQGANMTNRSIATSRMATLLGLDKRVAKTVPVEFEKGLDIVQRGILMETVKGLDISRPENVFAAVKGATGIDTDSIDFIKQAYALRVMDAICGQVDRHPGNVLFQTHIDKQSGKAVIDGLKAIDHDMSFGVGMPRGFMLSDITAVDKETKEAIESVTPEMLDYMFSDVLEPETLLSLKDRFSKVRDHLKTVKVIDTLDDYKALTAKDKTVEEYISAAKLTGEFCIRSQKEISEYAGLDYEKCLGKGPLGEKDPECEKMRKTMSGLRLRGKAALNPSLFTDLFKEHAAYEIRKKHLEAGDKTPIEEIMLNPTDEDKAILKASAQLLFDIAGDEKKTEAYLNQVFKSYASVGTAFVSDENFMKNLTADYPELFAGASKEYAEEVQAAAKATEKAPEEKQPTTMKLSEVEAEEKAEKKAEEEKAKEAKAAEKAAEEKTTEEKGAEEKKEPPVRELIDLKAELGSALAGKIKTTPKEVRKIKTKDGEKTIDLSL